MTFRKIALVFACLSSLHTFSHAYEYEDGINITFNVDGSYDIHKEESIIASLKLPATNKKLIDEGAQVGWDLHCLAPREIIRGTLELRRIYVYALGELHLTTKLAVDPQMKEYGQFENNEQLQKAYGEYVSVLLRERPIVKQIKKDEIPCPHQGNEELDFKDFVVENKGEKEVFFVVNVALSAMEKIRTDCYDRDPW